MNIALDYDETYTKDPIMWQKFIDLVQLSGHDIMIVTYRDPSLTLDHDPKIPVYFTSYKAKRTYMENKGIQIDVWIDDSPETIVGNSEWTDEQRKEWKLHHFKTKAHNEVMIDVA